MRGETQQCIKEKFKWQFCPRRACTGKRRSEFRSQKKMLYVEITTNHTVRRDVGHWDGVRSAFALMCITKSLPCTPHLHDISKHWLKRPTWWRYGAQLSRYVQPPCIFGARCGVWKQRFYCSDSRMQIMCVYVYDRVIGIRGELKPEGNTLLRWGTVALPGG